MISSLPGPKERIFQLDDMSRTNSLTFFLICLTLVFTTVAYGGVHQPILALFYALIAAIAISTAIGGLRSGALEINQSRLQIALFAAAIYGFIQVIPFGYMPATAGVEGIPRTISVNPFATQVNALHFLALSIFFSATLIVLNSISRITKTVALIIIFGFLFAFYAILQSVMSPNRIYGIYESQYATPFGSFVNRHNFAAFMEMSISIPLGMLFAGSVKRDRRLLYITAVSLMGIALILSGSRGGFVAMLAGLIMLLALTRSSRGKRALFLRVAFAAALLITIVGGAIFVGGETSLSRFVETSQSKDVSANRLYIWSVTLKIISANMPFGAGLGAFGVAFTPFDTNGGQERVEQAHNDYLQVVSDAGLIGLTIGGFFIFFLIKTGLKSVATRNNYRRGIAVGAFAGCCSILVHSLFDFVLHTTAVSILFLMVIGLVVASGREYVDDIEEKRQRLKKRSDESIGEIRSKAELVSRQA
jgi:O-antigen ligase